MLLMNAWQDHALNASVVVIVRSRESFAAIDGDFVTAIDERRANLLGKLLKATISIGNSARANNRDLQVGSPTEAEGMLAGMRA